MHQENSKYIQNISTGSDKPPGPALASSFLLITCLATGAIEQFSFDVGHADQILFQVNVDGFAGPRQVYCGGSPVGPQCNLLTQYLPTEAILTNISLSPLAGLEAGGSFCGASVWTGLLASCPPVPPAPHRLPSLSSGL